MSAVPTPRSQSAEAVFAAGLPEHRPRKSAGATHTDWSFKKQPKARRRAKARP